MGSIMTVNAATSIKDVFDADYYSSTYGDLNAAFGEDAKALYNHYVTYGQKEGRTVVPFIDLEKYRAEYADLNAAFGDNMDAYLDHYIVYGVFEGRKSFGTSFDARAYADRYADLKAAFGYDVLALYKHWIDYGKKEGRNAMPDLPVSNSSTNSASVGDSSGSVGDSSGSGSSSVSEAVATTVVFRDEAGNPIPNAVVRFQRTGDLGMNTHSARSVTGGDSISGGDAGVSQEGDVIIVTTDAEGRYTVPELPAGVYEVDATAPGYLALHINSIQIGLSGEAATLPTFEMLSADISGTNTVEGYAVDASTGGRMADVRIRVRLNWNNYDGDVLDEINTDEDGHYSFTLERNYYTIEFAQTGYSPVYVNISASNQLLNADRCTGVLSAIINEVTTGQYRIVLTWGEEPRDLDSHIVGPSSYGYFHVYFADKSYEENGELKASLDVDDISSYGPETVTVLNVDSNANYYYSVHDYTNGHDDEQEQSIAMANSSANVKVYDGATLVREYNVPSAAGTVWNVFKIENGTIISINQVNSDYETMFGDYLN